MNTVVFAVYPGNVIPLGQEGLAFNKATSLAAYTQLEFHVTRKLDIVGGIRVTKDNKTGTFTYDGVGMMNPSPTTIIETPYKKTKPNFLIGVNYKPALDTLVYGKFSTSFVSGGPGANPILVYGPETASSWEGGVKADTFDHRLRTNLAVYTVSYKHVQAPQGSANLGSSVGAVGPFLGTFILDQGGLKNSGAELEVSAAPARGISLGGSLDYSHTTFNNINPLLLAIYGGGFEPTLRPEWSGGVWGQYESQPVFGDAYIMLRIDANWHDKENADPNSSPSNPFNNPSFAPAYQIPATWLVNGRLSLRDIQVGRTKAQLSVWAKNLTDDRSATFPELLGFAATAIYQKARTFGVDLNLEFK